MSSFAHLDDNGLALCGFNLMAHLARISLSRSLQLIQIQTHVRLEVIVPMHQIIQVLEISEFGFDCAKQTLLFSIGLWVLDAAQNMLDAVGFQELLEAVRALDYLLRGIAEELGVVAA